MDIKNIFKYKKIEPYTEYHYKIYSQLQEKLEYNTNSMVLDTETNGQNKIVQISYYILNDSNDKTHSYDFFLNDGTHTIDFFKKFDVDFIQKNGIDANIVLTKLADDFTHCKRIVCHNTSFDLSKLKGYFETFNIKYTFPEDIFCTMAKSKNIVKATNKNNIIKNPKLGDLCSFLSVEYDTNSAHDGLYDVDVTYQCYKKLIVLLDT